VPKVPADATRVPEGIQQLHAAEFRNATQLPGGGVLIVGSGQSGCQIADDLAAAGRRVYLATSRVGRLPWHYRGRQVLRWLVDAGFFAQRLEDLDDPAMARVTQPIVAPGGRDLSLPLLARSGVTLLGRIVTVDGARVRFDDSATANVLFGDQFADRVYHMADAVIARSAGGAPAAMADAAGGPVEIAPCPTLDLVAADITSIIWCTGFTGDFSWVHLPVLDAAGQPAHQAGATAEPGVRFVGLPWLTHRASGVFLGVGSDAERTADAVTAHLVGR
jgi:putative flavoprotein involved in K+ transport